jgi:hypothetical protein
MKPETPAYYFCAECAEIVVDPHVHKAWWLSHPLLIEQQSTSGMDLEPVTQCVILWSAWCDMAMSRRYYPSVSLS